MGTVLIGSCSGLKDMNRKCTESDILSLPYAVISLFFTILPPELASEEKMASVLTAHPFWLPGDAGSQALSVLIVLMLITMDKCSESATIRAVRVIQSHKRKKNVPLNQLK